MTKSEQREATNLTELAEFFPVTPTPATGAAVRAVPMHPGETLAEAVRRQDERTSRIRAALARAKR